MYESTLCLQDPACYAVGMTNCTIDNDEMEWMKEGTWCQEWWKKAAKQIDNLCQAFCLQHIDYFTPSLKDFQVSLSLISTCSIKQAG